jgi:bifunctional DNA-binding transcriptional regulator/antitoxin component of YhaV-PrlF toxin-antitoxin module
MVKFKNLELSAVIPKKMVTEWGLKVGDKVMVHIEEGGGVYIYKNKFK